MGQQREMIFSFEQGVPESFRASDASTLTISDVHYKDGSQSLQWDFESDASIRLSESVGFAPFQDNGRDQARSTFCVWIYNEVPIQDQLIFEFGRSDINDCWFTFGLDFEGWRSAWVVYERDMEGQPYPDMDTLIIRGPKCAGRLFFDQMMLSVPVDPRFPTRDRQVPFVNIMADEGPNAHWLSLYLYDMQYKQEYSRMDHNDELSGIDATVLQTLSNRYEQFIWSKRASDTKISMDEIRERFAAFSIQRNGQWTNGRAIELPFFDHYPAAQKAELQALTNPIQLREYTKFMLIVAFHYREAQDERVQFELKQMFLDLVDHLDDQGWSNGSSQGTVHHLGYNLLDYYPAMFLMQDVLREAGKLERSEQAMFWYSGTGRIYMNLAEVEGNIDIFNTTLAGMFASILMMDNLSDRTRLLLRFRDWLEVSLVPARGLRAAYKIDGSAYHHVHHYPAYAVGGFQGVAPVLYFMSGTPFRIREEAHTTLRKALLMMRLYSNKYEWLVSLAGRHPTGKWALDVEPYRFMLLAGSPDGKQEIDAEMAAAYLRLCRSGADKDTVKRVESMGVSAENDPNGHWTMNYASLVIHRRDHWLAGVRGHSRYLCANETYLDCNLYGRYITYGHLQIMSQGDPVNNEDSGYRAEGWDWNRWPGATTIHLPYDQLRSDVRNVDTFSGYEEMLLSDETFAGGLNLEGQYGMFAMKIHEHPKYDGSHRARKSVFFFDNRIICLGTNIENDNSVYPTETTLFQSSLIHLNDPIWVNGKEVSSLEVFEAELIEEEPILLMDNKSNGYYISAGSHVGIFRGRQHSKHQKNDSDTWGHFATAWIDHGAAPKDAEYEYAIIVQTEMDQLRHFADKMKNVDRAAYIVLKKDKTAHIVMDRESGVIGYALFEANDHIDVDVIASVDTPSMVMTKRSGDFLSLSVVDPDLRLYDGKETDQYDENGEQIEVSVYSRTWVHAKSEAHDLQLTLKGQWTLVSELDSVTIVSTAQDSTVISIRSQDAMPIEVMLKEIMHN